MKVLENDDIKVYYDIIDGEVLTKVIEKTAVKVKTYKVGEEYKVAIGDYDYVIKPLDKDGCKVSIKIYFKDTKEKIDLYPTALAVFLAYHSQAMIYTAMRDVWLEDYAPGSYYSETTLNLIANRIHKIVCSMAERDGYDKIIKESYKTLTEAERNVLRTLVLRSM